MTEKNDLCTGFSNKWNLKVLFLPPLIITLLILSWISPLLHVFWDALDLAAFQLFNGWIAKSYFWQNFWAIANHKKVDWLHDIFMLSFFFLYIRKGLGAEKIKRVSELIFCILLIAATIFFINKTLFHDIIPIPRSSPSITIPNATLLSQHIDWLSIKDYSRSSFPGDHGTTACLFAGIVCILMGRRLGILAIFYAIFFCLPRLIVGAHWVTDLLFGSLAIAIFSLSIAVGTPLAYYCVHFLQKGFFILSKMQTKRPPYES
ncbi:MAG: phosphatase PAP2 family protein [Simkaniaceae bacterium]|nr:phosphatase PAP2 family protein [Simkaniaceae bacterium]